MNYEEHYKKRFTRSLSLLLWHMSDTDELHRLKNDEYQILGGVEKSRLSIDRIPANIFAGYRPAQIAERREDTSFLFQYLDQLVL